MSINGIDGSGLTPIRPQAHTEQASNRAAPDANTQAGSGTDRDRVEISPEARALASQSSSEVGSVQSSGAAISPDRMHDVLNRIGSGFYDRPDVQGVVAQRALGDIQGQ